MLENKSVATYSLANNNAAKLLSINPSRMNSTREKKKHCQYQLWKTRWGWVSLKNGTGMPLMRDTSQKKCPIIICVYLYKIQTKLLNMNIMLNIMALINYKI